MDKLPNNFDHIFYSNYYPDLKNAFGYDKPSLENHYIIHGRFENRKYCLVPENFNWKKYILLNPDIFNTMESMTKNNAINHFLENNVDHLDLYLNDEINDDDIVNNNVNINKKPIYILYYAFLNNDKDWRHMIQGQIFDIYKSGIINVSMFHAVLLGTPEDIQEAKILLESILNIPISITEVIKNEYEFPAIIKIRELAIENPDKIFIYIHSKGMVNHNYSKYRTILEQRLTLNTFLDWESTLYIFDTFPNIQKAGLLPGETGLCWFNFWWARASYLISCEPIKIPENMVEPDRFICEEWLGSHGSKDWHDCYSLTNKNISFSTNPSDEVWSKF
jgi:hypothetical protein